MPDKATVLAYMRQAGVPFTNENFNKTSAYMYANSAEAGDKRQGRPGGSPAQRRQVGGQAAPRRNATATPPAAGPSGRTGATVTGGPDWTPTPAATAAAAAAAPTNPRNWLDQALEAAGIGAGVGGGAWLGDRAVTAAQQRGLLPPDRGTARGQPGTMRGPPPLPAPPPITPNAGRPPPLPTAAELAAMMTPQGPTVAPPPPYDPYAELSTGRAYTPPTSVEEGNRTLGIVGDQPVSGRDYGAEARDAQRGGAQATREAFAREYGEGARPVVQGQGTATPGTEADLTTPPRRNYGAEARTAADADAEFTRNAFDREYGPGARSVIQGQGVSTPGSDADLGVTQRNYGAEAAAGRDPYAELSSGRAVEQPRAQPAGTMADVAVPGAAADLDRLLAGTADPANARSVVETVSRLAGAGPQNPNVVRQQVEALGRVLNGIDPAMRMQLEAQFPQLTPLLNQPTQGAVTPEPIPVDPRERVVRARQPRVTVPRLGR